MVLITDNLTKVFPGDFMALSSISLKISSNECFGILGPNGAGKTTLLKILKGLLVPTTGSVSIEGVEIDSSSDTSKIKRFTGYLPEDPPDFPMMTARDYLSMVAILYGVPPSKAGERIQMFLDIFGLPSWGDKPLGSFSEGMKQKIHWAATLIHDPPIILLDDPLRALDIHSFKLITELLERLKKLGKTVIISTHYLSLVEKACDRVAIIHSGKLVLTGTIQDILAETGRNDLYESYLEIFPGGIPSEDIERLVI
ncbi:MAG: ABC transporter ATP-binding protein [Candidatus Odinarchaeota archaeon]